MPKFNLKSGKDVYDIEHTQTETFDDFQAKVFALTDIPPKNLKVLFKGKMIKDNQSLFQVTQGSQLIIMGTKAGKQLKQTSDVKFQNVMIEEPKKVQRFGLTNIGNTCYMNASIQFLKSVPKINNLVRNYKDNAGGAVGPKQVALTLSSVFKQMDKKDVVPKAFVMFFLNSHPQFLPFGTQHDADQFMQRLIQDLSNANPEMAKTLQQQFQIQLQNTLKNKQIQDQPPQVTLQTTTKIGCNLGGNQKEKIGTLMQGIKLGLKTKVQKKSPIDELNHTYQSESKFSSLPSFLIVQMIRFFWKQVNDPDSNFNKPQATKICRVIDFGGKLDVFDLCTEQLKAKLQKGREAYQQNKKAQQQQYKKQYEKYKQSIGTTNRPETRLIQQFKQKWSQNKKVLTEGLETGIYEITAVVTHLGGSVQSGHYMAWIKQTDDQWIKYDDDTVYTQPEQKVFQLRGGQPNLQIAYMLMFRKIYAKPL